MKIFRKLITWILRAKITIDNEILGGQTVFMGTRVPVEFLFDHLEGGISLDAFFEDFPTVTNDQGQKVEAIILYVGNTVSALH